MDNPCIWRFTMQGEIEAVRLEICRLKLHGGDIDELGGIIDEIGFAIAHPDAEGPFGKRLRYTTALEIAMEQATRTHLRIAAMLVDAGASLEKRDHWGDTPLQSAAKSNFYTLVERMLSAGANPHTTGGGSTLWTPLHDAAWRGWEGIVALLLKADPSTTLAVDASGRTPEDSATAFRHFHIAKMIHDA